MARRPFLRSHLPWCDTGTVTFQDVVNLGYCRAVTTGPITRWRLSAWGVRTGSQNRNPVSGALASFVAPLISRFSVRPNWTRRRGARLCWLRESDDPPGQRVSVLHSFPVRNAGRTFTFSMPTAKPSSGSIRLSSWRRNFSLKSQQVTEVQELIEEHLHEIRGAWAKHFPSGSH